MGDGLVEQGPTPVVILTATVRGQTWRGIVAIDEELELIDWAAIVAAAVEVFARAQAAYRERGLPAPKLRACSWRGGMFVPDADP